MKPIQWFITVNKNDEYDEATKRTKRNNTKKLGKKIKSQRRKNIVYSVKDDECNYISTPMSDSGF